MLTDKTTDIEKLKGINHALELKKKDISVVAQTIAEEKAKATRLKWENYRTKHQRISSEYKELTHKLKAYSDLTSAAAKKSSSKEFPLSELLASDAGKQLLKAQKNFKSSNAACMPNFPVYLEKGNNIFARTVLTLITA